MNISKAIPYNQFLVYFVSLIIAITVVATSSSNERLDYVSRQTANNNPIQTTVQNARNRIRRLVEDFEYNSDYDSLKEEAISSSENYDNDTFYLARCF